MTGAAASSTRDGRCADESTGGRSARQRDTPSIQAGVDGWRPATITEDEATLLEAAALAGTTSSADELADESGLPLRTTQRLLGKLERRGMTHRPCGARSGWTTTVAGREALHLAQRRKRASRLSPGGACAG